MKKQNSMTELFGPVISSYTRKNALDDGTLVDITETANEAGLKVHTACTRSVWERYIQWDEEDSEKQSYQDQSGRLWDVVWMALHGIRSNSTGHARETLFRLNCIPRDGKSTRAELTTLKIHIGPGDEGEPVFTIMLPNED